MVDFFNTILEMSIKGGVVIIAVILLRALLSKAPRKYSYLLWIVVGFRLCCPISFRAIFSIFSFVAPKAPSLPNVGGDIIINGNTSSPSVPVYDPDFVSGGASIEFVKKADFIDIFNTVVMVIWFVGTTVALIYTLFSYFKLKIMMSNAIRYEGNVFMSEKVSTPFALGYFKPRIYIPYGLDKNTLEQILLHERCHIRRLDHIIKPMAFLILAVHWFNPLCWIAFRLMSLDMEMSCDEKVLRTKGDEVMKKNYTLALLSFASNKRFPAPSPIAFSESSSNAKKRIKHALYWKKPKFFVNLICILLCIAALVACAADADGMKWKEVKTETFGEQPYNFVYKSNGDGTCVVSEIRVDKDYSGDIHLIIPEKAPNGDTVVEINFCWGLNAAKPKRNVPSYLTFESMKAIKEMITNAEDIEKTETRFGMTIGANPERDAKVFEAFFAEKIDSNGIGYYELEKYLVFDEKDRLSAILEVYGYDEEACYNDAVKFLDAVSDENTRNELAREAFKYLYFDGSNITEITLPESVKLISYGSFDGCDRLQKINGISNDCKIGVYKEQSNGENHSTVSIVKTVIVGTPKEELRSCYSYDENEDFINALD
ncbi:MAG: hypothetical protein E7595_03285 [Ruminococcaceae bacterium]|nr:hypothetical protein [Oscillospiraceae bacterium]